jgi:hypothetical protein
MCVPKFAGTNASRLRFAATEPMSPYLWSLPDGDWSRQKRYILAGTVFAGGVDAIRRGKELFTAKVLSLLRHPSDRVVDQDQLVWSLVYREHPDAIEPVYTAQEWLPVFVSGAPPVAAGAS